MPVKRSTLVVVLAAVQFALFPMPVNVAIVSFFFLVVVVAVIVVDENVYVAVAK